MILYLAININKDYYIKEDNQDCKNFLKFCIFKIV